jgi:hypothetical protein
LGSSLFARHYSGSRGFFPFLRVLRCFSSPACLYLPYVFRQEYARITTRGFPHSEIPGSKVGQHLPRAYRSRPRPSSALGAKASTVCPCSLDRKEHVNYCYGVFKVRADRCPQSRNHSQASGLSKLNSVRHRTTSAPKGSLRTVSATSRPTYSRRARTSDDRSHRTSRTPAGVRAPTFPRKEVIQPHLPVRLPCYDFTPIIDPTFDGCLLAVSSPASGIANFRGVTGGVYKPRERIHRDVADSRLLATPPS